MTISILAALDPRVFTQFAPLSGSDLDAMAARWFMWIDGGMRCENDPDFAILCVVKQ